jgi:hypothetical protein
MGLIIVQQWYQKIPSIERNQPLIITGGHAYSPNQVLTEVQQGTALGQALQTVIESRSFTEALDKYALAILRWKERLSKMPKDSRFVWDDRYYTPAEMLYEIENGTPVGRKMIEAEVKNVEGVLQ